MLIDDDPKKHQLIQDMLAQAVGASFPGRTAPVFDVESARRLSEGLALLGQHEFDVVLLDISGPESQGADALAKVCNKAPEVPVVVITGARDGSEAKLLKQGAQDFIYTGEISSSVLEHSLTHAVERASRGQEARSGDRRFRALIENAQDGIVVFDANIAVRYNSPANYRIFGYVEGEGLGSIGLDHIHPDDLKRGSDSLGQAMQNPGVPAVVEVRCRHKDGSWRHIEVTTVNHLNNPAVKGVVANFRDITERKNAQEPFRLEMEFYKQIIEHAVSGLVVIAPDSRVLYQSPAAAKQYGLGTDTRTGMLGWDFIHPDDIKRSMEDFVDIATNPGRSGGTEARFRRGDGTWSWINAVGTNCILDPIVKGIVMTTIDVNTRKATEEALKKSQQQLKEAMSKLRQVLEERSTPAVQIWNNVLALPLIGTIDDLRAQDIMEVLLNRIVATQSELVIVDVTGVPSMDTTVTDHLIRTIRAAHMLGAQCVLTGMKPELAQAVIQLGSDTSTFIIRRDMEEGLHWALEKMAYQATSDRSKITEGTLTSEVPTQGNARAGGQKR